MTKKLYLILFIFTLLSLQLTTAFSQNVESIVSDSTTSVKSLSIDQISSETETLRHRISDLSKILRPSTETHDVDSIIDTAYVEIMMNTDSLYSQIDQLTRRDLKIRKVTWAKYKSKLKSLQKTLNDRAFNITEVNDELVDELEKWNVTKEKLSENSESEDVFASLDTMILTLNSLIDVAHVRLDSVFSIQKKLTELILIVDEANSEISRIERQKQKEYFVLDSDPLWKSTLVDTAAINPTHSDSTQAVNTFITGVNNDIDAFNAFVVENLKTATFQVLFILLLFVIMLVMHKQWKSIDNQLKDPLELQTKKVFENPIASTLVVGVLITAYFYDALIPIFGEVHVLIILLATIVLLPKLTNQKIRVFLLLLLAGYFIEVIDVYFVPKSTTVRWLQIIEASTLIAALIIGRKIVLNNPIKFAKITILFRYIIPIYWLILGIAIIINIIGMVNLSSMLTYGVMLSVALGMVVSLAIKVITSILVLFFKIRKSSNVQALSGMVEATNQRFQPALVWLGIILWLFFTLTGFDVFNNIVDWVNDLLQIGWRIGEMKISLGSILSFFTLLIITLIAAKILAAIFQDDWMIQTLPRGVAPAISLLLRIFVISVGLYLAFTSAGFDLSKMGFIFGALGVGIGFGLQNVVLNFIAGLILAFERPINLGDAIEIDNESGVVTSIGVRSSNIRTWSGAEAIIPNGDLISKKVINWTLTDRNRRSKILMRTAASADPDTVIALFNKIAIEQEVVYADPAPKTYFYGYGEDGNLKFALLYWTTFSDTLKTDSAIALLIYNALKEAGIEAPMPNQRNFE